MLCPFLDCYISTLPGSQHHFIIGAVTIFIKVPLLLVVHVGQVVNKMGQKTSILIVLDIIATI